MKVFPYLDFGLCSKVYKAIDKVTGEIVALRKLKLDMYGEAQEVPEKSAWNRKPRDWDLGEAKSSECN